tara:strand:- start:3429 stop:3602 length:174 start_codon:yes stop_codon:yes gene_type:complete
MYTPSKKEKLADLLVEFELQLRSFKDDVCENWSVDGFLEHLENAILEINEEISNDEN